MRFSLSNYDIRMESRDWKEILLATCMGREPVAGSTRWLCEMRQYRGGACRNRAKTTLIDPMQPMRAKVAAVPIATPGLGGFRMSESDNRRIAARRQCSRQPTACIDGKDRVPPYAMSHTNRDQAKLLARIRRLKGQMEAVERALDAGQSCGDILNLVASVRGAVNGLTVELIEDHIRGHVAGHDTQVEREEGAAELIEIVRRYLK